MRDPNRSDRIRGDGPPSQNALPLKILRRQLRGAWNLAAGHHRETAVEGTGRFALELGYTVTLVKDATAASTKEWMHAAVELNAPIYAESVLSTAEVIARIRWHDWRHIRRAVYSPRSELSLARRSSSSANSVRRRLISRLTRVSSALACCSLT